MAVPHIFGSNPDCFLNNSRTSEQSLRLFSSAIALIYAVTLLLVSTVLFFAFAIEDILKCLSKCTKLIVFNYKRQTRVPLLFKSLHAIRNSRQRKLGNSTGKNFNRQWRNHSLVCA